MHVFIRSYKRLTDINVKSNGWWNTGQFHKIHEHCHALPTLHVTTM